MAKKIIYNITAKETLIGLFVPPSSHK